MELVRMGDSSVKAYEHLISLFKKYAAEMKPFTEIGRPTTSSEKAPYEGLSNAQNSAIYAGDSEARAQTNNLP